MIPCPETLLPTLLPPPSDASLADYPSMNLPLRFAALLSLVAAVVFSPSAAQAVVLYADSFNRADNPNNIDAVLTGITDMAGTSLPADGVYSQPFFDPNVDGTAANGGGAAIQSNQLQLAVGNGTSNAYINHNFTNASILTDGGFSVSLQVVGNANNNNSSAHGGAFALGMSTARADTAQDAFNGVNKFTGGFGPENMSGGIVPGSVVSDFWVALTSDGTLRWGGGPGSVVSVAPAVGTGGTISANFNVPDFNAGTSVGYEVLYNGEIKGAGAFSWSETNQNYIGIDARDAGSVTFDNLSIATIVPPAVPQLVINRDTGEVSIANTSELPLAIAVYNITTQQGRFNRSNARWMSLADSDSDWLEFGPDGGDLRDDIAEGAITGSYEIAAAGNPGDTLSLGTPWERSPFEDIAIDLRDQFGVPVAIDVVYTGTPILIGDFNLDGVVSLADYTIWRDNLGASNTVFAEGDANGDGSVTSADYQLWKAHFGESASMAQSIAHNAAAATVPEPTALLLAGGLAVGGLLRRRLMNCER